MAPASRAFPDKAEPPCRVRKAPDLSLVHFPAENRFPIFREVLQQENVTMCTPDILKQGNA
jgi:hypothetical protein